MKRRLARSTSTATTGALALLACAAGGIAAAAATDAGQAPPTEPLPVTLRATGFFAVNGNDAGPGNLAFSPQYPLWSDGAQKRRWINLPVGAAIDASRPDAWAFPVGTRFFKEFSVGGRKVETRVIERRADGHWQFGAYVWNGEGTDAVRAPAKGTVIDFEIAPGKRYVVPGELDCRSCHEGRTPPVLGFNALQLSPDRDPGAPHGSRDLQALDLRGLVARGVIRGLPAQVLAQPPRIPAPTTTARAALGYLAANCGGCHNNDGPLAGLEMTLDPTGAASAVRAVIDSTVGRPSRFLPPGATGDPVRIAAGRPDLSVLVVRMQSRDPLLQMPPLGSQIVDQEGLALIERWIAETEPRSKPQEQKP